MLPQLVAVLLQIPYLIFAAENGTHHMDDDDQRVHCPRPDQASSSCDAPTFFTYRTCCGEGNMFCCMRLQLHVVIGIAVILLAVLLIIAGCLVNWICQIKRKGHQSYDFS
ncbi:hypothetical protein Q1695_010867 [Nippostrongylus brasiliensis]|nr:hypothetical protein Q1695_010867 [Nippostrongylus brasiliensis]